MWSGPETPALASYPRLLLGPFLCRKIYMEKSGVQLLSELSFTKSVRRVNVKTLYPLTIFTNNGTLSLKRFVLIVHKSESYLLTERAEPVSLWHSKQRRTKASCVISSVTLVTEKNLWKKSDINLSYAMDSA